MKKQILLIFILISFIFINGCKKDETPKKYLIIVSSFAADKIIGYSPLIVKFTNNSENATSYLWNFGDGTTSTEKDPTHTFINTSTTEAVSITVKLTSTDADGRTAYVSKVININRFTPPIVFNPNLIYGTMTDKDGNVYKTIKIGDQTWMAENLRTTKYNDGTDIPFVKGDTTWKYLSTGAYCTYENNTDSAYIAIYGRLYNWVAVNTGKLAPTGWHVPTDEEWTILTTYLGGENIAGNKMKEIGTTHWNLTNSDVTNESGFTALGTGYLWLYFGGYPFYRFNISTCYWSSTQKVENAWIRVLSTSSTSTVRSFELKASGLSVRCIKD